MQFGAVEQSNMAFSKQVLGMTIIQDPVYTPGYRTGSCFDN